MSDKVESHYALNDDQRNFILSVLDFWKGDEDTYPPDRGDEDIRQTLCNPLSVNKNQAVALLLIVAVGSFVG